MLVFHYHVSMNFITLPAIFYTDGVVSLRTCPLITSLSQTMAGRISVQDSCMQSVSLIRILYYINKYWGSLYQVYPPVSARLCKVSPSLVNISDYEIIHFINLHR